MKKQIVITVNLDAGLSDLSSEEIGYVGEFIVERLKSLQVEPTKEDEMEGTTDISYSIKEV